MSDNPIGEFIKEKRLRKGMTQRVLADLAGVSSTYIYLLETKKHVVVNASLGRLTRVFDALGYSVEITYESVKE